MDKQEARKKALEALKKGKVEGMGVSIMAKDKDELLKGLEKARSLLKGDKLQEIIKKRLQSEG